MVLVTETVNCEAEANVGTRSASHALRARATDYGIFERNRNSL